MAETKAPEVTLKTDGKIYGGWKEIRIARSMERIFGTFDLAVTERWEEGGEPRPIRPGAECQVLIDEQPVITGYVDDVGVDYDAASHTVSVSGRDRTGDLTDCSTPFKDKHQWIGQSLIQVAELLCKPFKIAVTADVEDREKFKTLRTEPGSSVFEALDAAAKVRAVLLISDGLGGMLITRASEESIPASIELGENVLACSVTYSHKNRFSEYTVLGQGAGDDTWWGVDAAQVSAKETDKFIERFRPLAIISDRPINGAQAKVRAKWERNVRFGRSQKIDYTVQGWTYAPGKLWPLNRLVHVRDSFLGLDEPRLITGVTFTAGASGMRTALSLMPREAFDLIPLPEPNDDGGVDWTSV